MGTVQTATQASKVVSREEWLIARTALLAKEKELTRLRDQLSQEQRALPWVRIEKDYVFDGRSGNVTLAQLFNGRSQLLIKHFMMGPGQRQQCVGCSLEVDHVEGILEHLENHDISYVAVARAPIEEIEIVRKNMGWRFTWVSSYHNDFNYDFNVSFTGEQIAARSGYYNFRQTGRPVGQEFFLQRRCGPHFSHLFELRPRRRGPPGYLSVSRHLPEGAKREWAVSFAG